MAVLEVLAPVLLGVTLLVATVKASALAIGNFATSLQGENTSSRWYEPRLSPTMTSSPRCSG